MDWCTIESDPGVFTELINQIGVKGVQVDEIYDLNDADLISTMNPIYGLIFLFRWTSKQEKRECLQIYDQELFFANQVIQNACATQAILSILLNNQTLDLGADLQNYKEYAMGLNAKDKGLALGQIDKVRIAHNSFARPEPFQFSGKKKAKDGDDVFHFISYIPFKNHVYELDGLQEGPILLGEVSGEASWLDVARAAIMKRISIYQDKEIAFTLLSVNQCRKTKIIAKTLELKQHQLNCLLSLQTQGVQLSQKQIETLTNLQQQFGAQELENVINIDELTKQLELIDAQITEQDYYMQQEQEKGMKFQQENIRRKHNYIPFILELFKIAQRKGQLQSLIDESMKRQQQKQTK